MKALPPVLGSDEALMRLVGFKAQQVRQGVCQRGAATRQGPRTTGPSCPDTLAEHIVQWNGRDREVLCNGVIRALAKAGVLAATVTGIVEATDLETTAHDEGCGQVTRQRKITATRGHVHEIDVTVDGWTLIVLIEAHTTIPLAAKVVPIQDHDTRSLRALVTPARTNLASHARRHNVGFARGCLDGVDLWWLAPRERRLVVPAKDHRAVTVDAQAQAAAGEGLTGGRRIHLVRQGQGNTAWTERQETAVVGLVGLTTDDQDGTPEHGRHHTRRDFQPNPINAVVVRQWNGHAYGPAGTTVFRTHAPVDKPLQPFDDDDDRSLIEHCSITESKPQWSLQPPPQKTARAMRVHVLFTWLLFALATAYRWPCEPEDSGGEPVGWQRWRRQLLEQTRDHVIVCAQDGYGIFHLAEDSWRLGVHIKDRPPGIGTHPQILAKYGLTAHP